MPTFIDFTQMRSPFGTSPARAEGLRIASTIDIDALSIDWGAGPIGSEGFRKGMWKATYDGQPFRFYASVSHAADYDGQMRLLRRHAALHLGLTRSGAK